LKPGRLTVPDRHGSSCIGAFREWAIENMLLEYRLSRVRHGMGEDDDKETWSEIPETTISLMPISE
jgi:hypothetical protein